MLDLWFCFCDVRRFGLIKTVLLTSTPIPNKGFIWVNPHSDMERAPSAVRMLSGPPVPGTVPAECEQLDIEALKLKPVWEPCSERVPDIQTELCPKQQEELVVMSLSIQQGALQASFLKRALQVEQQQECQELQVLSLLNLESKRAVREEARREVYIQDTRDWVLWKEESCDRLLRTQGMQASQNYWSICATLVHTSNCCYFSSQNDTVPSPEPHWILIKQYNWTWRW